jgi:hypothetical protein
MPKPKIPQSAAAAANPRGGALRRVFVITDEPAPEAADRSAAKRRVMPGDVPLPAAPARLTDDQKE